MIVVNGSAEGRCGQHALHLRATTVVLTPLVKELFLPRAQQMQTRQIEENIAQVFHVLLRLIARELRGGIESGHFQAEKIADRIDVLVAVQAAKHSAPTGTGEILAALGERSSRLVNKRR